ncbi:MAG TPA: ABC transporter ATP-binding protein [bacterium]|nr:ABC transporter ATP-binding protein [bacterium]
MSSKSGFRQSLGLYLRLLAYLKPYTGRAVLAVSSMVLAAGSTTFVMYQLKPIINATFLKTGDADGTFHQLAYVTVPLTFAAALLRALTSYGQDYLNRYLGQRVVQRLRNDLYTHFLKLPMSFFNVHRTGGLAARITSDVQVLQDSLINVVGQVMNSGLMVLGLAGLLIYLDWQLAAMALVVFPLALYPIYRYGRKIRQASGEGQTVLSDLNAQIHETLAGIRVVKGFAMEPHERRKFQETNDKFFSVTMRANRAYAASSPIVETIGTLALLVLILWMAYRALYQGNLTVGDFISFLGATFTLYPNLKSFNGLWGHLQQSLASAERCFDILDTVDPMVDAKDAVEAKPLKKTIEFRKVSFEYVKGHPVLRDISFEVRKGEVVALVGPSGGGKSTLADLIPRFYQPTSGQVLWDGKDLSHLKLASLRAQVGIVTQETILFHDSILKNIAYGRPGASFWDVQEAAKAAYAKEFIENTPQGFNTLIGERGIKLSGGQRQRLAIARALLKNPPVLILDEATSALDTESERLVQKALEELMGHRTTLVIAHRLSTVRRADRILVVDKGRIVEQGKHGVLLAKGGLYARLYKMQFRDTARMRAGAE